LMIVKMVMLILTVIMVMMLAIINTRTPNTHIS
jgi:hypothetical protein